MPLIDLLSLAVEKTSTSAKSRKGIGFGQIDALAIGVTPEKKMAKSALSEFLGKSGSSELEAEMGKWPEFAAKAGEILEITYSGENFPKVTRIYLVGTGDSSRDAIRKAGAAIGRKVKLSGKSVALGLPKEFTASKQISTFVSALLLSQYTWNLKSESDPKKKVAHLSIIAEREIPSLEADLEAARIVSEAVWNTRDLVHTPSNIKNPEYLAKFAKSAVAKAKNSALTVHVRAGKELAEFGGVRAVGNSSPKPGPRVIEISYKPRGTKIPHVVIVGKGITFDTGGISLKRPYDTMMAMKSDMAGAAAVMSTVLALAELGVKVRVTALMMCAENALSATSQRPSDVITHFGGKTVEVLNTDAEGRLVLADGLAYADLKLNPDYIVDIATLTGSATLGLGRQYAAMYTRNQKVAKKLYESGEISGDRVWHMPLIDDYKSSLHSDIADINHTADKDGFSAGSVTAALFLEEFVGKRTWVHLDIAGTGRSEVDAGEYVKGGTGFGVRLLTEWISSL